MKKILLVLLVLGSIGGIIGYGLFEARKLLAGPSIRIVSPLDGSAISEQLLTVEGVALNLSFLTINDRPVLTDEAGRFTRKLSPPPGATTVVVQGIDRFGRRASADIHITMLNFCSIHA